MNKFKFKELMEMTFDSMRKLTATKGEEYSRSADQLANFKRYAQDAGVSQPVVWLVLFNKHVDAIKTYVKAGETLSEPIEGRIDDAILYLMLLKAIIADNETRLIPTVVDEVGEGDTCD